MVWGERMSEEGVESRQVGWEGEKEDRRGEDI